MTIFALLNQCFITVDQALTVSLTSTLRQASNLGAEPPISDHPLSIDPGGNTPGSLKRQEHNTIPERLTDKPNQHSSKGPVNKATGYFLPHTKARQKIGELSHVHLGTLVYWYTIPTAPTPKLRSNAGVPELT